MSFWFALGYCLSIPIFSAQHSPTPIRVFAYVPLYQMADEESTLASTVGSNSASFIDSVAAIVIQTAVRRHLAIIFVRNQRELDLKETRAIISIYVLAAERIQGMPCVLSSYVFIN